MAAVGGAVLRREIETTMPGEIPPRENKRGGPGWWLDPEGIWRAPAVWPEDYPPLEGWVRNGDGTWSAPRASDDRTHRESASVVPVKLAEHRARTPTVTMDRPKPPKRSRQAEADVRAMLLVGGAFGAAALLVVLALILQSRAGANVDEVEVDVASEVVFAAETDALREQRRAEATLTAPPEALALLAQLELRPTEDADAVFDETQWVAASEDCLDLAEQVLIERSKVPVVWIDNLECVPSEGLWSDQYLGIEITRTIDAEVRPLVPPEDAFSSGGDNWTPTTRSNYLSDTVHPATLMIVAADAGHNPRGASPAAWRPSDEATWCGYAIDWVAVKSRWELSVSEAEFAALDEMLATCDQATSNGPHPSSMVLDPIEPPIIDRLVNR